MSKRFFEGAKHSLQYSLFRPRPPLSLIEEIVEKVPEKVIFICNFVVSFCRHVIYHLSEIAWLCRPHVFCSTR